MKSSAPNAIVTCITANWLAPACVAMLSAARNLDGAKADLMIVVGKLEASDQRAADAFMRKHRINVSILEFSPTTFSQLNPGRYSRATFKRLCLDELLPQSYRRVLYIDGDILVLQSLAPLFEVSLNGTALGAVPEAKLTAGISRRADAHRKLHGFAPDREYFNAGVLLFDWEWTLSGRFLERARRLLLSGRDFEFFDQDVLNLVFSGNWHALPLKWNAEQSGVNYLNVVPALRHFNHSAKPWHWPWVMGYRQHYEYYAEALKGLELSAFLQMKAGDPFQAMIDFLALKLSFRKRARLRRHFAALI